MREVISEYKRCLSALMLKSPFIGSFITKLQVKFVQVDEIAFVDDATLYLTPLWMELDEKTKYFVLAHEAMHIALLHSLRAKDIKETEGAVNLYLFNVAADCVINRMLEFEVGYVPENAVTPSFIASMTGVPQCDVERMSTEETYNLLKEKASTSQISLHTDLIASVDVSESKTIQEGSKDFNSENVGKEIKLKVSESLVISKIAGKASAEIEREVGEILKPKINWRMLRQSVINFIGRSVVNTYTRMNRRVPDLPGIKRVSTPDVFVLIDTSGSISNDELEQFLAELYSICKTLQSKLTVVVWESGVKGVFKVTKLSDLKKVRLTGGGGTRLTPALQYCMQNTKRNDVIVIFSDFIVSDPTTSKELLERLASRCKVICATTRARPKVRGVTVYKL